MSDAARDANAAMRDYWNTVAGPRWAAAPEARERRNRESIALLLDRLGLTGGERVLEVGCGAGALTVPLAAAVGAAGRVVAVDISEPMLGAARKRIAERGVGNVELRSGDAQTFAFERDAFDVATSRMGVMFFADPAAAFRNIGTALKPDGRLVFACWGPLAENRHWLVAHDAAVAHFGPPAPKPSTAPGPLAFGDPDYVSRVLAAAGFADIAIERASDDRGRQPRGGGEGGARDGTDGTACRGEKPGHSDTRKAAARHRGGVCRGRRRRPGAAAGHHLSRQRPPPGTLASPVSLIGLRDREASPADWMQRGLFREG